MPRKGYRQTEKHRENLCAGQKRRWERDKDTESMKLRNKRIGRTMKQRYRDCPELLEKRRLQLQEGLFYGKIHSDETKKVMSEQKVELWQDPEYVQRQMKARNVQPNKTELKLDNFLQQFLPNEYKYVGDGEFILAGKCPDFVNINGQKKIIELFGNYWHQNDDGGERIKLFEQYGYQTLIVQESELENKEELRNKILNFHREALNGAQK